MVFIKSSLLAVLLEALSANAYILQGVGLLGIVRKDPVVQPGVPFANHSHAVGGSPNFDSTVTSDILRAGQCTSAAIAEDFSNYWVPNVNFRWANGTYSSLSVGFVTYYLFDQNANVTAFPDNFRMVSGTPTLRSYDPDSKAQQAVTFMCLDFNGVSTTYKHFPTDKVCPSGIRAQINFPSCWDGKNIDSPDHKSHMAFPSGGPDSGTCDDPNYPITTPRIFMESYWDTGSYNDKFDQAFSPRQPFVLSTGDVGFYGWHADFYNAWKPNVLQNLIDKCGCTVAGFGDPSCCADLGVITFRNNVPQCNLAHPSTEQVTGLLAELPGGNIPSGLLAVNNGEIYANGTWDLVVPLDQQPYPGILPGAGTTATVPSSAAASVTSSAEATSTVSSVQSTSTASSIKATNTVSSVNTVSSTKAASTASSVETPTSSSSAKPSANPISSGSSPGSNGNSDTWSTGGSSSGSVGASSGNTSSGNTSSGQSSTSQSSSNNQSSSSNNSKANSGSSGNTPAQNPSPSSSDSWNSGMTQVAQASPVPSSSHGTSSSSSGGSSSKGGISSSGNPNTGSDSGSSGNNVPAPAQSSPSGSGTPAASNQSQSPPASNPAKSSNSGNSSSGTSRNADKCKNRHASSLESRAEALHVKHAAINSHNHHSRSFHRVRYAGDMLV